MSAALLAGLLAGYGIAIPVGAVGAYLVALTARTSLRVGAAAALGIATVDGLYAVAAVLGGAALAGSIEAYAESLRWVSAAVLLVMAAAGAGRAYARHRAGPLLRDATLDRRPATALRSYVAFIGITAVNPLTVVYFAALVVGSRAQLDGSAEATVFVAAAFAASASWQLLLASGGALLGRVVTSERGRLTTALVSSAVIVALAVSMMAD
ncbi:LysE family transporter [Jiangella asiatica]|uniref:Lysine transporter LysE n=1 Tax=Jiangella asiatica TaxID=2530372 RepID=A0A4R5CN80_9ACTN|nr:LysE family transporter [Jiangella asiatica]TDD99024.1 lysine transporter LysE [Jiangella asiatica]